ncbi:Low-affinity potassium transport protein [Penicillium chermesinum]|uniref:Potassium transport protein n=1 Tax=Penicillium chermesinum TaxID=63820 RepID=A0A9W9NNJ0_9EURO|nr:Low-affinity potassium transport protein [Penicillium chermesinum]KAJ5223227.1 Low-affinity potassium transport protein [Penicillium chermesinum]
MWTPPVNFLTLHYTWILTLAILSLVIIYPYGNLKAVDAFFFGASASTESGLNTIDVKVLKTYQQVYIYVIPILGNLGFINIVVVVVRLHWFEKYLRSVAPGILNSVSTSGGTSVRDVEGARSTSVDNRGGQSHYGNPGTNAVNGNSNSDIQVSSLQTFQRLPSEKLDQRSSHKDPNTTPTLPSRTIKFGDDLSGQPAEQSEKALYIPPPWKRDRGSPILEVDDEGDECESLKGTRTETKTCAGEPSFRRTGSSVLSATAPLERVASMLFRPGESASYDRHSQRPSQPTYRQLALPNISSQATIGRNSQFYHLTTEDRERLGGIEYRSLKLLLKIVTAYFFGLHLFGAICLVPWILRADPKYRDYLAECGQGSVWWGFYSAQTMVNNLGFTLTPDSMISFQDAEFPLIVMSFLAYAGNTCYPCLLRFAIWTIWKFAPEGSSMKETLGFLLDHPRRCYTLLFPSRPTWVLFGVLFVMNFIDIILIIVLDLNNPTVNILPAGTRLVAAIFQAASSRHTGTATFNLADVNPAVQFSLFVMMYIAVFPIAISMRASNTYEEKSLGVYAGDDEIDEGDGRSYVLTHIRNQLTFDLWYIFFGVFCITIAESGKIADTSIPAFSVWSVLFEVVSAYANVGLSLGYPTVNTSLSGEFTTFSKLIVCAMMIRGRHRGLPYKLDRAIVLPGERLIEGDAQEDLTSRIQLHKLSKIKRYHTS